MGVWRTGVLGFDWFWRSLSNLTLMRRFSRQLMLRRWLLRRLTLTLLALQLIYLLLLTLSLLALQLCYLHPNALCIRTNLLMDLFKFLTYHFCRQNFVTCFLIGC